MKCWRVAVMEVRFAIPERFRVERLIFLGTHLPRGKLSRCQCQLSTAVFGPTMVCLVMSRMVKLFARWP